MPILAARREAIGALAMKVASGILEGLAFLGMGPVLALVLHQKTSPTWAKTLKFMGLEGLSVSGQVVLDLSLFACLGAASALFKYGAGQQVNLFRLKVEATLRRLLTDGLFSLRWEYFLELGAGSTLKTVFDHGWVYAYASELVLQILAHSLLAATLIGIAAFIMPLATLVAIGLIVLGVIYVRLRAARQAPLSGRLGQAHGRYSDLAAQTILRMKYVRGNGLTAEVSASLEDKFDEVYKENLKILRHGQKQGLASELIVLCVVAGGLLFGLTSEEARLGEFVTFLVLVFRAAPQLQAVQKTYDLLKAVHWSAQSWNDLYSKIRQNPMPPSGTKLPSLHRSIQMNRLSYRYPQRPDVDAVSDLSLELRRGQCLVLVGSSGSGKSTIVDLVTGLLVPTRGEILVDGVPLGELDTGLWRRNIAFVPQGVTLSSGTIRENIVGSGTEFDESRLQLALVQAQLVEFVGGLENGIDTPVGEGGGMLSGGQRQRIALAWAMYRRPWLLLLDEPTSALDKENAALVMETLKGLRGTVTMLIITHDLSFAEIGDEVIELSNGKVVGRGLSPERGAGAQPETTPSTP